MTASDGRERPTAAMLRAMTTAKRTGRAVQLQTESNKTGARYGGRFREEMNVAAKKSITKAFQETGGNVLRTAKLLGMSQPSLWKWCQKLGIDADDYRE